MRWGSVVLCALLVAACGDGGPDVTANSRPGSSTSTASSTSTSQPTATTGSIDGLEVSSHLSAFFARHGDTTYVVDAGPIGSTFEPTLRAFDDDAGTVRTYDLPTSAPLLFVAPLWADDGLSILGVECPGWKAGEQPVVDWGAAGSVAALCRSADLVLIRWEDGAWSDPVTVFAATSGYELHSAHGARAVLGRIPGDESLSSQVVDDPVVVDLLTGEVDDLPPRPKGTHVLCLQEDGPVALVDPEADSSADEARWTAQRLDRAGVGWAEPVELPAGYGEGCLAEGGLLFNGDAALRIEVREDGSTDVEDLGAPPGRFPSYDVTTLGIVAESEGTMYVLIDGEWVDVGPEPRDTYQFANGRRILVEPSPPDPGENEPENVIDLVPVTLALQG